MFSKIKLNLPNLLNYECAKLLAMCKKKTCKKRKHFNCLIYNFFIDIVTKIKLKVKKKVQKG